MASGAPIDAQREKRWPDRLAPAGPKVEFLPADEDSDCVADDDIKDLWGGEEVPYEPDGEGAGRGEEAERGHHLDVEVFQVRLPLGIRVGDDVDGVGNGADARGTVGVVEFLEAAGEEGA